MGNIFRSRDLRYKSPFGAVKSGEIVRFLITPGEETSAACLIVRRDDGEPQRIGMQPDAAQSGFTCDYSPDTPGLYWYHFEIIAQNSVQYICRGDGSIGEIFSSLGEVFQLTVYDPSLETPGWIKGGILYQIFPDRFCKEGNFPADCPAGRVLRDDWDGTPIYAPNENGKILNNDFFGGNLSGIISRLPYLASLGVTGIYLNPVFEASANHRYNTGDYLHIDPLLGENDDLRQLCDIARKYGISVILDGVFNHTGDDSVYFNRCGRYPDVGAYQSQASPYYPWYCFDSWPDDYLCWWGFPTLPTVNKQQGGFTDFIAGSGGVLEHWMQIGVSGWRLDVADELPEVFLKQIRQTVKAQNPNALLLGEVWEDASNKISYGTRRHYLGGDELDSVMNYPLRGAILAFIRSGDGLGLNESILTLLEHYPPPCINTLMNHLGTHDTERLITALAGEPADGHDADWRASQRLPQEEYDNAIRLVTLAAAIQFFLPGVPCIYYGDEAGMEGYADPFNRRCYPWGDADDRLLTWYRRLGRIRRACPALAEGSYQCIAAEQNLFAFLRSEGGDKLICAVNLGSSAQNITLPKALGQFLPVDGLGRVTSSDSLPIPPGGCRIFGAGKWISSL